MKMIYRIINKMRNNANDNMCYDDQNVNANVNKEYTCRW